VKQKRPPAAIRRPHTSMGRAYFFPFLKGTIALQLHWTLVPGNVTRGQKALLWLGISPWLPKEHGHPLLRVGAPAKRELRSELRRASPPLSFSTVTLLHTSVTFSISRHGFYYGARLECLLVPLARVPGSGVLEGDHGRATSSSWSFSLRQ
jgi:hypothetical protein